jgi:hypothetical protein
MSDHAMVGDVDRGKKRLVGVFFFLTENRDLVHSVFPPITKEHRQFGVSLSMASNHLFVASYKDDMSYYCELGEDNVTSVLVPIPIIPALGPHCLGGEVALSGNGGLMGDVVPCPHYSQVGQCHYQEMV